MKFLNLIILPSLLISNLCVASYPLALLQGTLLQHLNKGSVILLLDLIFQTPFILSFTLGASFGLLLGFYVRSCSIKVLTKKIS